MTRKNHRLRDYAAVATVAVSIGAALLASAGVRAAELSWSGFGSVSYAVAPDAPGNYLRWINGSGTLNADSVFGLQADARMNAQWSATVQVKAVPSATSDSSWSVRPSWAIVGFRPSNEWLIRAGRLRIPLYLYSESLDVGESHDMARLPVEMYSIAPTNETNGLSVGYTTPSTWLKDGDLQVEASYGRSQQQARLWFRDGAPPFVPAGAFFRKVEGTGLMFTASLRNLQTTWRATWLEMAVKQPAGQLLPQSFPYVPVAPGLGYYRVSEALPGPPIPYTDRIRNRITTLGVDHRFAQGWRVTAEYSRTEQMLTGLGSNTQGGYVAGFKDIGSFTPYVSVGELRTRNPELQNFRNLAAAELPAVIPGADGINAAQRMAAESIYMADQRTLAVGSAWRAPFGGKFKVEWARTRVGEATRLVDTRPGSARPSGVSFDTWTASYHFTF